MTNSNNDIEELEELLTELEGQEAQIVTPYSEEDDAVTRLMDAPLGDQDWMVQVTALDRRMMSTSQLLSELQSGKVNGRTLVWRGGMDDWMPVSRIDELARASSPPQHSVPQHSAPQHNAAATQRNSGPRAAYQNLAPPPPVPQQRSQPLWSSPGGAPLPPPPSPMSPPFGMAPGVGLPPPPLALAPPPPPPVAMTPPPAPPTSSYGLPSPLPGSGSMSEVPFSQGNTTRPVAVDFSDMMAENDPPLQSKRWVMALSAVAILAVFVTVYSLSSGGGESAAKEPATAAAPRAVAALQPSSSAPKEKEKPAASAAAAPKAEAASAPAMAAASSAKASDEEDESESSPSASARQTAQARYTPRSENRRRSRGGGSEESSRAEPEEESAPAPAAAAVAAPSTTARAEDEDEAPSDPVGAVAEEVDEPPKSTGKSGNTFNREAAKAALDEAAGQAKNCRPQGGPSGTGRVQVRYEPSGKVSNVAILTSKFDNTTAGSCVRMLFRRAKVPEFTGAPVVVVNKSFEIP
jgi:hypothetical protein